jgi:histidinol dehydrogenase
MKVTRFDWSGEDPAGLAAEMRDLQPKLDEVRDAVAEIIAAVESEGDAAVLRFEQQFGGAAPATLRVPADEIKGTPDAISEELARAIATAAANVHNAATAEMEAEQGSVVADDSKTISYDSVPVASAGAYVPGGAGAYVSTAIMCCVPAQAAGVERIAVASPPGPDGRVNPAILTAATVAGATELYAMGGAQAVAALGLGTESVPKVDLIAGPGNRYVQEAKRQLVGRVGIDGIAGPSELMVIADATANPEHAALDICAQAEHGDDGLLVVCSPDEGVLDALAEQVEATASQRESVQDAPLAVVTVPDLEAAVELANALAPEHLELACAGAEELAGSVSYAGCVFVGGEAGTAFGDYAVGSNHVLPTGGAGRFTGPLDPRTFRRRTATVRITPHGAEELAPAVATLARAEGFPVHAESAEARAKGTDQPK